MLKKDQEPNPIDNMASLYEPDAPTESGGGGQYWLDWLLSLF